MGILDKVEQVNQKHEREAKLEKEFVESGFRNVCPRNFLRKERGSYRLREGDKLHNTNSRKLS